jgi:hypothetical protein
MVQVAAAVARPHLQQIMVAAVVRPQRVKLER